MSVHPCLISVSIRSAGQVAYINIYFRRISKIKKVVYYKKIDFMSVVIGTTTVQDCTFGSTVINSSTRLYNMNVHRVYPNCQLLSASLSL